MSDQSSTATAGPLSGLNLLLSAPSKQAVDKAANLTFLTRHAGKEQCIEAVGGLLGMERGEAEQVHAALYECIRVVLAAGSLQALADLFKTHDDSSAEPLNPKLKTLVGQILTTRHDEWIEACHSSRVSLPRLIDLDWAVHWQRANSEIAGQALSSGTPSVFVALNIEQTPTHVQLPAVRTVQFELSREGLETVVDGLGKIRDQLSKMG
mmetsp:Transcript_12530/g.27834  ORF Transcript_12530/g.27834 Transcript_12530/m.27834 type:complete len:209 (-) Transcript_12530:49-675(-)|eukprot:CAMPEP_0173257386 /NCGR_PEP_ID=MMETSP1142-20121109/23739_1 /TAXON_ID=483371 /ORGANISM="non described non described, Strain CCMP2298" /LENGTH=208 /DNA_ID=CAMNT_0014191505 /DNA_START=170 /DNA_END=796 /DNA_ORIENTATION=+